MEPINYFEVLGVDSEAGIGEIKKAYRKLVFKYHPDYNHDKAARRIFIKISKAYKVLADPVTRDEHIKGQSNAVTDEPWVTLNDYWENIFRTGFQ